MLIGLHTVQVERSKESTYLGPKERKILRETKKLVPDEPIHEWGLTLWAPTKKNSVIRIRVCPSRIKTKAIIDKQYARIFLYLDLDKETIQLKEVYDNLQDRIFMLQHVLPGEVRCSSDMRECAY